MICDNDKKYGPLFERVAQASGIEVIHTPYEAPRANAICERFVGSLRRECLDHVLVIGRSYVAIDRSFRVTLRASDTQATLIRI